MKKMLFILISIIVLSLGTFVAPSMAQDSDYYKKNKQKNLGTSKYRINGSSIDKKFLYPSSGKKGNIDVYMPEEKTTFTFTGDTPPYVSLLRTSAYSIQQLFDISQVDSDIKNRFELFKGRLKSRMSLWLSRASYYVPLMAEILAENGIPLEIVYLPLIESGFSTHAVSRAGATGQWQFMPFTARRYGLKIDKYVDERRDPEKATKAAAAYLKDLYAMFGDWNLALSSYNAGEGRVMNAVSSTGIKDFWTLKQTTYLPSETRKYVPTFIAAAMIAHEPSKYGFSNVPYQKPMDFDLVMIETPMDLQVVAQLAEADKKTIRHLNPELKNNTTPLNVDFYLLRIPEGKRKIFFKNYLSYPKSALLSM